MKSLLASAILLALTFSIIWQSTVSAWSLYYSYKQVRTAVSQSPLLDRTSLQQTFQETVASATQLQVDTSRLAETIRQQDWPGSIGQENLRLSVNTLLGTVQEARHIGAQGKEIIQALGSENIDRQALLMASVVNVAQAVSEINRSASLDPQPAGLLSPHLIPQNQPGLLRPDTILSAIPFAPDLIGLTEPKTYLILAQNSDELRATGGFVTAIGEVTIDQGKITRLVFEDSYKVDDYSKPYPEPPLPLYAYMKSEIWVFRDGNWSPDYPTSVQAMLDLYHISRETKIDGVIAVDPTALQRMVKVMEPIAIPDWNEPVTSENVLDLMRTQWEPNATEDKSRRDWLDNRKSAIGEIVRAMRHRMEQAPLHINWLALGQATIEILTERHLQVWFADETIQAWVERQGWDGSIRQVDGDYLMVIDTNLGFNKASAIVDTRYTYEVFLEKDAPIEATLTIQQQNNSKSLIPCSHKPRSGEAGQGYWEVIQRCYWSYLRVYVPQESHLQDGTAHAIDGQYLVGGQDEPAQITELPVEGNKQAWGTFLLVPHNEKVETEFQYTLPQTVLTKTENEWHYTLTIQKQAGTLANEATVIVHLPTNSTVTYAAPDAIMPENKATLEYNLSLQTDTQISFSFK